MSSDNLEVIKNVETSEAKIISNVKIDQNRRKIDQLKEKLHMKVSALNAVRDGKKQNESKVKF